MTASDPRRFKKKITPVLLSGGTGTRLWPLSREAYPKQFLPLFGQDTLLQQTARRVSDAALFNELLVIANVEHRFIIAEQLRAIGQDAARIVLEPAGRNTAAAAAAAAIIATRSDPDSLLLLMPADHCIDDIAAFHDTLAAGLRAAQDGSTVLFGITPTGPATGYGYIRMAGEAVDEPGARRVLAFKEKPDLETAESYIASGEYVWNSGIFLVSAQRLLDELDALEPELLRACTAAVEGALSDLDFLRLDAEAFAQARDVSLDYAVMEKTRNAVVVPARFSWSDIGTWSTLWEIGSKTAEGTVAEGNATAYDTQDCYFRSEGPLIAALGVRDLIVVATQDAVLVTTKGRDHDVRSLVESLKKTGNSAAIRSHREHRPWGYYQTIHYGDRFKVKRITVNSGAKLSLQKHEHRAEHWIVVSGTALVTRDNEQFVLRADQSTYLPRGCIHRLENPGSIPLNIIEVQSGSYLGEDDILRLEDAYARI
ncbi:mannose-1-phosphate guanylyltransferase/mannose-6-phosphate isomerase [Microvirga alba]|uniref:mannose-1-phosphate guanylyltransferase n=1 Tax=Microvirga alba TaxID=2791025 RepID=A0A931FNW0_9HYPH|nr:mannose-1-phosphate guanylyltransferase/mannose-6-phosphate isomerase [Microvirga alba]MBF9234409.1 mannose-1-phosphate guanylyltransferase/mannose-6-phosphate isomerase [Microvirga alba]